MAVLKIANEKGKYSDIDSRATLANYVLNEEKAPHYYGGYGVNIIDIAESMDDVAKRFYKTKGVQLRHFIVSFSENEKVTPRKANDIAIAAASFFKHEYQVVFAVHENTANPHIHIFINSISYVDGHRYGGTRKEFYEFFNYLRNILKYYFGVYFLQYVS